MAKNDVSFEECHCNTSDRIHGRVRLRQGVTQVVFTVEQAHEQFKVAVSNGIEKESNWKNWYKKLPKMLPDNSSDEMELAFMSHLSYEEGDYDAIVCEEAAIAFVLAKAITNQYALAVFISMENWIVVDWEYTREIEGLG